MVTRLQSSQIKLAELTHYFGLTESNDPLFFSELHQDFPELDVSEIDYMDQMRSSYLHMVSYQNSLPQWIETAIIGPLLCLTQALIAPFNMKVGNTIEIPTKVDGGAVLRGDLNSIIMKDGFWAMAIECQEPDRSIEAGLPRLLSYLLANPNRNHPCYGMVSTGGEFVFVKLVNGETSQYALSEMFALRRKDNELYDVFKILKHLINTV